MLPHTRGCFTSGQSCPERERLGARLQLASLKAVRKLGSPSSKPRILAPSSPRTRKSAVKNREGSLHGAAGGRISLRGSGRAVPKGRGAVGHPQPRDSNLASARTAELGRAGAPGRPPAEHRPDFPPSRGRRPAPRGSESRRRHRRVRWGRGRATSARRVGRTKRRRRRRELFSVSAPRSLKRLLTEAGSPVVEKVGARQRPRPGAGASEASRASHEPARRPRPFLLPSLPSRLEAGGRGAGARGRGRAARAGPAGSCSSPPRAVVGLPPRGRAEALHPGEVPSGRGARGCAALEGRAVLEPHFAVR